MQASEGTSSFAVWTHFLCVFSINLFLKCWQSITQIIQPCFLIFLQTNLCPQVFSVHFVCVRENCSAQLPLFYYMKMEELITLNNLMHFSVRQLKGFKRVCLLKPSFSPPCLVLTPSPAHLLSVEECSGCSSLSLQWPVCSEMGSEDRSSAAMSQKISSVSRSNSSSSSKLDSRQVKHNTLPWKTRKVWTISFSTLIFSGLLFLFCKNNVFLSLRDFSVSWEEIDLTVNALTTQTFAIRPCGFIRVSHKALFGSLLIQARGSPIWGSLCILDSNN